MAGRIGWLAGELGLEVLVYGKRLDELDSGTVEIGGDTVRVLGWHNVNDFQTLATGVMEYQQVASATTFSLVVRWPDDCCGQFHLLRRNFRPYLPL